MTKNRIMWNIALFLIIIISLPIAYAQAFTGNRIILILINAAIVGVILFLLQSFLIPGKSDKEKTSVWVAIIVGSLLIGWFFGSQGFIWQHPVLARFFSIYVLVNAIIIGTALYFILGLLDINKKLGSPEGKAGYGILIFLVAVIFAVNIGNQWIWQKAVVQQFIAYLFGAQGILNPAPPEYRLWAFLAVTTLLAFFFNGYLLTGGAGGTNKVNYALAILIGSSVARAGISFASIVLLGEAIFTIVLAKALQGTAPQPKGIPGHWILAGFLVGWASAAMTYGTEYQGWLATIVGTPLWAMGLIQVGPTGVAARPEGVGWFGWVVKMGGGALLLLFVIPFILFFIIFRGENRRRILGLAWSGFMKRLNSLFKFARFLRATPEGREPQFIMENRLLFHALANYTTRSEITYRYWAVVKQGAEIWKDLEPKIQKFLDQKELRHDIMVYRSGGVTSNGEKVEGWNGINLEVVKLVNTLLNLVSRIYITAEFKLKDTKVDPSYQVEGQEFVDIKNRVINLQKKIATYEEEYTRRTDAFGAHHVLNAYKGIILNMSNPTGDVREHPQKFARPGAKFKGGASFFGPDFTARKDEHEVNQFGEYVQDIVDQKDKFGRLPEDPREFKKPRKLENPHDIIDYSSYVDLMKNIGIDWKGLAEDIRYGLHHPMSRIVRNYTEALRNGIYYQWNDDKIPFTDPPSPQNFALDMRALADPGKNVYWGRLKWDIATELGGIPPENPYPILSSLGLRDFLDIGMDLDIKPPTLAARFKEYYPADSQAFEKDIERGLYIGMKLSQIKEAQQKQGGG